MATISAATSRLRLLSGLIILRAFTAHRWIVQKRWRRLPAERDRVRVAPGADLVLGVPVPRIACATVRGPQKLGYLTLVQYGVDYSSGGRTHADED
jgi:hypothetical protein